MKIATTSTGAGPDAAVDPRLGRCAYFAILDTESGHIETTPNPFLDAASGAGMQVAQWLAQQGVDVLLTGQCGPKAAAVLRDAGLRVIEGTAGNVREAAERFTAAQGDAGRPNGLGAGRCRGKGRGSRGRGGNGATAGECTGQGGGPGLGLESGPGAGRGRGLGHRRRS